MRANFRDAYKERFEAVGPEPSEKAVERFESEGGNVSAATNGNGATHRHHTLVTIDDEEVEMADGSVAIAAITSCTNTSNPSVMLAAGLLAKKAVERGLRVKPSVKTSLAPGSRAVTDYLNAAGVTPYLEALHFHTVGYGCTTCIAEGTPVLLANGTTRRIEDFPTDGGAKLFAPTADGRLGTARQAEMMVQGERECISLVLQDGRTLVCTPDHKILCADGRWVRADELALNDDRVVVGLEAPLDEPGADETGYSLPWAPSPSRWTRRTSGSGHLPSHDCSATFSATALSVSWGRAA